MKNTNKENCEGRPKCHQQSYGAFYIKLQVWSIIKGEPKTWIDQPFKQIGWKDDQKPDQWNWGTKKLNSGAQPKSFTRRRWRTINKTGKKLYPIRIVQNFGFEVFEKKKFRCAYQHRGAKKKIKAQTNKKDKSRETLRLYVENHENIKPGRPRFKFACFLNPKVCVPKSQ